MWLRALRVTLSVILFLLYVRNLEALGGFAAVLQDNCFLNFSFAFCTQILSEMVNSKRQEIAPKHFLFLLFHFLSRLILEESRNSSEKGSNLKGKNLYP